MTKTHKISNSKISSPAIMASLPDIATARTETLLWIGSRREREFLQAYRLAETMVGQIAHRHHVDDAIARPATRVDRIVIARPDSATVSEQQVDELGHAYPSAQRIELTGVCCAADPAAVRSSPKRFVPWHRAADFLPNWLGESAVVQTDNGNGRKSIAVLTASFVDAEGLIQIAESTGAVVIWGRSPEAIVARNIDAFWWDDSVIGATTTRRWDQILGGVQPIASPETTHVWLTGWPNHADILAARSAGVDHVISKPVRVDSLIATLGSTENTAAKPIVNAA